MITLEEYLATAAEREDWAPGWEQIDAAFAEVYPGVEPKHLASDLAARASWGGPEWLDGFSFFPAEGYWHLVSYGLTELYVAEEAYGGELSGMGYEMTMKVVADRVEDCVWAADSFSKLARYTMTNSRPFAPYQTLVSNGSPLRIDSDTLLTTYVTVPDTEVQPRDTVHGEVDFLQFVGITHAESQWITEGDPQGMVDRIRELVTTMSVDNPKLLTDLSRKSYR